MIVASSRLRKSRASSIWGRIRTSEFSSRDSKPLFVRTADTADVCEPPIATRSVHEWIRTTKGDSEPFAECEVSVGNVHREAPASETTDWQTPDGAVVETDESSPKQSDLPLSQNGDDVEVK